MNPIRKVLRWSLLGASLAAAYGQAVTFHFYKQGQSTFNSDQATVLARNFNLTPVISQAGGPTGLFAMGDGSVRLAFTGGVFHMQPSLGGLTGDPMLLPAVQKIAPAFFTKFNLLPRGTRLALGEHFLWSKGDGSQKNGDSKPQDLLITQVYHVMLDGLPVLGRRSLLSVTADSQGLVGVEDTLLPAVQTTDVVNLKSPSQVSREFDMQARLHCARGKYKLVNRRLGYYEQGMGYIQPAYFYDTLFTDDKGNQTGDSIIVPAATNSPEAIVDAGEDTSVPPIHPDVTPTTGIASTNYLDEAFASAGALQASPVSVGQYIVREDHDCWLNDAKAFWGSLNFGRNLTPWHQSIFRRDYWWDYPWCWEAALGVADNSPYFVNQDNLVQIEGHGAPWEITCYKNYGDVIHLNGISGYGANRLNGKTAWCIWQSCDVIPVPGDGFGGDYTSGSPFGVWWGIFKGMRGNFGYHTTMGICNGVGNYYGLQIGLGFPMVSSWLNCTASNPQGHPSGWNYGSCVIVSGHEGDTFYNNSGVPNPGSLTMWWIHP